MPKFSWLKVCPPRDKKPNKKTEQGEKMKRFLVLLVAGGLCLSLAFCGRKGGNPSQETTSPTETSEATTAPTTQPTETTEATEPTPEQVVEAFAKEQGLTLADWPESLIKLLEKNPEAKDFVLNYPLKKDLEPEIDLSDCLKEPGVPLLIQWDERWGYTEYAGEPMGLSGCGPTCLSMACIYFFQDATYTPKYVAEFSEEHGYAVDGNGSAWALIPQGGKELGLDVVEIPLDANRIINNLEVGNLIICVVGPGDFTSSGHFLVMTGYEDGYVKINDPNSPKRTEQKWELTRVMEQIQNLWVCRLPSE